MRPLVGVVVAFAVAVSGAPAAIALPPPPPGAADSREALAALTVRALGVAVRLQPRDVRQRLGISRGRVRRARPCLDPRRPRCAGERGLRANGRALAVGLRRRHQPGLEQGRHRPRRPAQERLALRRPLVGRQAPQANDLEGPQLVAVSQSSNRSKGDRSPDEWKPPRRRVWCLYARWWVAVKATWRLRVTGHEKGAHGSMLDTC
jgi:hypothetical protein